MTPDTQVAVVIHWGDPGPTMRTVLQVVPAFDQVVVIANDGMRQPMDLPPGVRWVPSTNVGYAGACARGAELFPQATYLAFLNNDLDISSAVCTALLAHLRADPGLGVCGPALMHSDGSLQSGAGRWSRFVCAPLIRHWAPGLQECEWLTGAALFCRGQTVRAIGFDLGYFLGFEDADFCERSRQAGWQVALAGDLTAVHDGRTTISGPRWQYYSVRNRLWFVRRRRSMGRYALVFLWALFVVLPAVLGADLIRRRAPVRAKLALHAVIDGIGAMPSMTAARPDEPRPAQWIDW